MLFAKSKATCASNSYHWRVKGKHTHSPLHFISLTQLPVSQWSQAFIIQRKAFDQPYLRNPNIPSVFIEIFRKLLEMHPDNDEKYHCTHIFPLWKIKQFRGYCLEEVVTTLHPSPFSLAFSLSTGEKRENKSACLWWWPNFTPTHPSAPWTSWQRLSMEEVEKEQHHAEGNRLKC